MDFQNLVGATLGIIEIEQEWDQTTIWITTREGSTFCIEHDTTDLGFDLEGVIKDHLNHKITGVGVFSHKTSMGQMATCFAIYTDASSEPLGLILSNSHPFGDCVVHVQRS